MKTEAEIAVMCLQAKKCQELPTTPGISRTQGSKERFFPRTLRGSMVLLTP